jgi:hypothetical protein
VLEEWRAARDSTGRTQEAHWKLLLEGSRWGAGQQLGQGLGRVFWFTGDCMHASGLPGMARFMCMVGCEVVEGVLLDRPALVAAHHHALHSEIAVLCPALRQPHHLHLTPRPPQTLQVCGAAAHRPEERHHGGVCGRG